MIDGSSRLRGLGWTRALVLSLAACGPSGGPTGAGDGGATIAFHFADDVGRGVRDGMRATFEAAAGFWGDPGPIEFWVAGRDVNAARDLARRFCELRASSGQRELDDCLADEGRGEELVRWAGRAGAGEVFFDAGWNGGFQWNLHLFSSSLPPGMAGVSDVRVEDDRTVLLHEYFHAIQQSHVSTLDWEERQRLMGPVWWVEGSADFMAQVACHELHEAGVLPPDPRFVDQPWRSGDRMELVLRAAQTALADRPGLRLSDVDYGPDAQIAYGLGAWAVALLCHRHGVDVLLERFYPALEKRGWEGAFVQAFGLGSDEFLREFDAFLELEPDQQRSILPWD